MKTCVSISLKCDFLSNERKNILGILKIFGFFGYVRNKIRNYLMRSNAIKKHDVHRVILESGAKYRDRTGACLVHSQVS